MSAPWPSPGQPVAAPFAPGGIAGRSGGPSRSGNKLLLGCGLAVGALLLLMLAGGIGAGYFVFSSGSQLPTAAVIGEESSGALHFRDDPEDPGLNAFLDLVGAQLQELDRRRKGKNLPENLRWMQELQGGQQIDAGKLRLYLPRDATLAVEAEGEGEERLLFAANPGAFVRVVKAMLTSLAPQKPGSERSYRGAELVALGDEWLGFHGGTVLFSPELPQLKAGVDRLEAEVAGVPPSPLRAELQPISDRWQLSGLVRLPAKELLGLLDGLAATFDPPAEAPQPGAGAEEAPDELAGQLEELLRDGNRRLHPFPALPAALAEQEAAASFGLNVAGADRFLAELRFDGEGPVADALRARMERLLASGTAAAEREGLVVVVQEAHAEHAWRLEITGVEAAVKRWAAELPVQ